MLMQQIAKKCATKNNSNDNNNPRLKMKNNFLQYFREYFHFL